MKTSIEQLRELYDEGKTAEVLYRILLDFPFGRDLPVEIEEIKGRCHFRREEYAEATKVAISASQKGSEEASELLIQLSAYVNKDDRTMEIIRQGLPNNSGVCNAFAIRARDSDSNIAVKLILDAAIRSINKNDLASINLLNNTARLLLEKGNHSSDTIMAIGLWEIALIKYGEKNYHHRAAVMFWMSTAYKSLGDLSSASKKAKESLTLWEYQISLDPTNSKFKKNLEGAKKRFENLSGNN
jgi:hypothetical protein